MRSTHKLINKTLKEKITLDGMLIRDKSTNEILPVLYNIILILRFHEEWKDIIDIEFNDPEEKLIIKKNDNPPLTAGFPGRWEFDDSIMTAAWIQKEYEVMVTPDQVEQAVRVVGAVNSQSEAIIDEQNLIIL